MLHGTMCVMSLSVSLIDIKNRERVFMIQLCFRCLFRLRTVGKFYFGYDQWRITFLFHELAIAFFLVFVWLVRCLRFI